MDSMPVGKMPHYSAQDSRLINELLIERRVRIEAEDRNQQFSTLLQRAGQKETYYINKNEKLHQKVKDLKAYGREAHSKCKELSRILQQVEEENKQLKQARHDGANNVLPKDQAEIQKLTKEVELLRNAHDRIIGEMQQQNSRADWRISELNKQNLALINERKVLKQKIRSLTEKQQAIAQENSDLKNEVLRLKQQLQFQQLKASSVDAASEVSDTETCSMRFSHSSIPNFLQMFEEQSKERQKVREEMQATLDRWTAHNPFSPTTLLHNENKENGEDTHSSLDGASSSAVEFHGSRDTLDNSLDGLDSTQDDSLSQVDSVLNKHRTATVDDNNLCNGDISKTESVVDVKSEEKQHEEVTEIKEATNTPQAAESKKEDSSVNDEMVQTLPSTSFGGVSLEDLRPGMNLEERLDYVDRLLEKEEKKAAEDQKEGLLDFRLLRSSDNDSLMQKVRRNLARIKQAKHGTPNDHSSVIEFAQNGYYNRFATPERDALDTLEFLKTIPTDTEGSAASSPAPTPTPSHPTVSTQRSQPNPEPTIVSHTRTASNPVNQNHHTPSNHTRTASNPVATPPMIRRNSLTNQLRASTRSTTNQMSRVNSVPSSSKRHRRTHSADSTLDNTIKIVDYSQKPWTPYRANYRKPAPNAASKRTPDFKALKYQQAQRRNSRHIPLHSSTEDMYKSQSDISVASVDSNASANSQSQYSVLRKPYRRSFSDDHANQVNGAPNNRVWSVSNECLKISAPGKGAATNQHQTKASGKKTSGFGSFWPKKESKQPLSSTANYQKVAIDARLGKGNNDSSTGKQQEKHKLSFWKSSPLSKKRQSVVSFTPQQTTTISTSNSNMAFESAQTSKNRDANSRPRSASFTSMQIMEILPPPPATSVSNFSFIGQSNSQLASSPREKLSFSNDALYETKRVNNMLITNL